MIESGYYIKARKIQESDIAHAPPHVREIWDWLLKEANHKDNGTIKRGQLVRDYNSIRDGLHWMVGYRKETYKKWHCENAMKWLMKHEMIATTKTTRGIIVTICNYDYYQDPKNYESRDESRTKAERKPKGTATINKNDKNGKNEELRERQFLFKKEVEEFKDKYSIEMLTNFYAYWSEPTRDKTKMRMETEKTWDTSRRLLTWFNRSKK